MKLVMLLFSLISAMCVSAIAQTPTPHPEKVRADRIAARLTDFPTLSRYREANAKLATPAQGEDRVVFFGDSITDGWKLDQYFPGMPFVNRGIGGQSTYHMLLRFRPDVIDLKPKVVVILAGTNDLASTTEQFKLETIMSNISSMVDLAHANGISVVIASVMPVGDRNVNAKGEPVIRTDVRPPAMINELNNWLKVLCKTRDLVYLDYFAPMADENGLLKPEIAKDGLHPNEKGYELIKPLALAAVRSALKSKQKPTR